MNTNNIFSNYLSQKSNNTLSAQRIDLGTFADYCCGLAANTLLSQEQTQILKKHPNTPQGYRDALLMCLLLDHGLRVGEISLLKTADFDLETGQFTAYRPKLDLIQTLKMTSDTHEVVQTWFKLGCATTTHLLRGSLKSGQLNEGGMSERAIQTRVKVLGKELLGLNRLSPEDCRHYWATHALELGVDLIALRDAGGWKSLAMPSRYISSPEIANQRLKISPPTQSDSTGQGQAKSDWLND